MALAVLPVFILPFLWEHLSTLGRAVGLAVVFGLVALEINIIYREKRASDDRYAGMVGHFEEQRRLALAHKDSVERLHHAINNPVGSVKRRALELSKEILEFAYRRMENEPRIEQYIRSSGFVLSAHPQSFGEPQMQKLWEYNTETINFYLQRFSTRVHDMYEDIVAEGVMTDENLDNVLQVAPRNASDIRMIGERMGILGELVPS